MKTPLSSILAITIAAIAAHAETGTLASDGSQLPKQDAWTDAIAHAKLQLLLESHKNDQSPLTSLGFSLNNANLQKELYQQFEKDFPDLLADALRSAGNMHNPKVLPLTAKFSESMLKTSTIKKIADQLKEYGYTIKDIGCEKFSIIKGTDPPAFYAIVFVTLNPRAVQQGMPGNRQTPFVSGLHKPGKQPRGGRGQYSGRDYWLSGSACRAGPEFLIPTESVLAHFCGHWVGLFRSTAICCRPWVTPGSGSTNPGGISACSPGSRPQRGRILRDLTSGLIFDPGTGVAAREDSRPGCLGKRASRLLG